MTFELMTFISLPHDLIGRACFTPNRREIAIMAHPSRTSFPPQHPPPLNSDCLSSLLLTFFVWVGASSLSLISHRMSFGFPDHGKHR